MEKLVLLVFTNVILLLSVPLHELCHFLALKCLGCRGKLKVTWFKFNKSGVGGKIEGENGAFEFPKLTENYYKIVASFIGLAGGLGAAIILTCIGVFFLINPTEEISVSVYKPFFVIAGFQLLYGIYEAIRSHKQVKLVKDMED